jgi:outer membrane receptor for ferric coprogen and ferric-rhodotorulic acid
MPNPINQSLVSFNSNRGTGTLYSFSRGLSRHASAIVAAGVGLAAPLAYPQSGAATSSSRDQTATLSPFVVNVDKDHGFVAASSLAGGRLAGNLRDTPVAYSVLTRDFIEALQLTDVTEMTRWFTNAVDLPDNNSSYDTGTSVRLSARGVSSELQRDFFPVSFNFDSYNVERLDLARGPNAILFGLGNAAGAFVSSTKRAKAQNTVTVEQMYDDRGGQRSTLDINRVLIKNVLAIRYVGLIENLNSFRLYADNNQRRQFLTASFTPFKKTNIRANYERGHVIAAAVRPWPDYDAVSPWIAAGRPLLETFVNTTGGKPNGIQNFAYAGLTSTQFSVGGTRIPTQKLQNR